MIRLDEACTRYRDAAHINPFTSWLIVENDEVKKRAHMILDDTVLPASRLTTPKNLARTILAERAPEIRIMAPEEMFLLMKDIAGSVLMKKQITDTLVENLIDLYITLTIHMVPYPSGTQKLNDISAIFCRYDAWCKEHQTLDAMKAIETAAAHAAKMQAERCIIYNLYEPGALVRGMLDRFCSHPEIIEPDVSVPDFLPETTAGVTRYTTAREELAQTLEKIAGLIESGIRGTDILVLTPSLQTTISLLEETAAGFRIKKDDAYIPLTFTTSERKSIQNIPIIRTALAWTAAYAFDFRMNDMALIISSPYLSGLPAMRADTLKKATIICGQNRGRRFWTAAAGRLAPARRTDTEKAYDIRFETALTALIEKIAARQSAASTLRERICALKNDMLEMNWTFAAHTTQDRMAQTAFFRLLDTFEAADSADKKITAADFYSLLSRGTLRNAGISYPANETAFSVAKLRSAAGIAVPYVFILNLTADTMPAISPTLPMLTARETKTLMPRRLRDQLRAEEYYFHAALRAAECRLYLSTAASTDEKTLGPSPYLCRYADAKPAAAADISHDVSENLSRTGHRLAQRQSDIPILPGVSDIADIAVRIDIENISRRGSPGIYDAWFAEEEDIRNEFEHADAEKKPFAPTTFEKYTTCPFVWYLENYLYLENPRDMSAEPILIGTVMHNVMQRFLSEFTRPVTPAVRNEATSLLKSITIEEFEKKGISTPSWQAALARYLGTGTGDSSLEKIIELETGFARDGFTTPQKLLECVLHAEIEDGGVVIEGRVDRILKHEKTNTFRVLDYKTGTPKSKKDLTDAKALQLPLYTEAFAKMSGSTPQAGAYYQIAADTVGLNEPYLNNRTKKSIPVEEVRDIAVAKCRQIREDMRRGICSPAPGVCKNKSCAYRRICRHTPYRTGEKP